MFYHVYCSCCRTVKHNIVFAILVIGSDNLTSGKRKWDLVERKIN